MARLSIFVVVVLLLMIQSIFVESWWRRRRRRRRSPPTYCRYPRPSQGSISEKTNDFFYGSTKLFGKKFWWGKRSKIVKNTWKLRHSLLMFRGKIFEWGSKRIYSSGTTGKSPASCDIRWSWAAKGKSRCTLNDATRWANRYRYRYGRYRLLWNNCHHFVNRLGRYLRGNCRR